MLIARKNALVAVAALIAIVAASADAGAVVVGGFESAYLSSWYASSAVVAGSTESYQAYDGATSWLPTEGNRFGYIRPTAVSPSTGRFSLVSELFTLAAGDEVSFDLFVDPANELGSDRRAMALLLAEDRVANGAGEMLIYSRHFSDNLSDADGWEHVSTRIADAGSYRLEFAISGDEVGTPFARRPVSLMGFDDVRITPDTPPVPEPGTLGLMGSALLMAPMWLARRRRA